MISGVVLDLSNILGVLIALRPEIIITLAALAVTVLAAWRHKTVDDRQTAAWVTIIALAVAQGSVGFLWYQGYHPFGVSPMVTVDYFRLASATIILLGALLTVLLSLSYVERERLWAPEYYALLLLAVAGMLFMAAGSDLVTIFLGLELMSVSVYVLAGINRRSQHSAEAALKYFLLGAFASAFLLYGIALTYGATGTTNLLLINFQVQSLALQSNVMLLLGLGLLLVGFGFKVAAVPFHMWAPDVYDGAPTPVTAFMAAGVKAAGFAALARVLLTAFISVAPVWQEALWWLAAVTMIAGNLVALAQRNIKRMLAYSSIAHAGYLLAALAPGTVVGAAALLFYGLAYTLMTLGAFTVLAGAGRDGERTLKVDDLAGLAERRPWVAAALTVFLLSLLGFPGTAGFMGKWYILQAIVDARQITLAVVLVAASVISAGYYLPIIMAMYMKPAPSADSHAGVQVVGAARWVLGVTAILLVLFGVWPNAAMNLAQRGGSDLRPIRAPSAQEEHQH